MRSDALPLVLIHVGLHKTATTWLQSTVFQDPEWGFASPWSRTEMLERLVLPDPLRFRPDIVREAMESGARRVLAEGAVPVLSHERFSGNPHSGGYDRRELAERLAAVWPGARVLIVIREQRAMILSVYRQYLREGGALSLRRYLDPPYQGVTRIPGFTLDFFEYDVLTAHYHRLFGKDRVLVLPYELLVAAPKEFVARIADFVNTGREGSILIERENIALSDLSLLVKRPLNRLLIRDRMNPTGLLESPRLHAALVRTLQAMERVLPSRMRTIRTDAWRRVVEERVGDTFAAGNRAMLGLAGLDLDGWGYMT